MATTVSPSLPVFLRIADSDEHQIGWIAIPISLTTATSEDAGLVAKVRLVDSANDRVRENLVALLRSAADFIEQGAPT